MSSHNTRYTRPVAQLEAEDDVPTTRRSNKGWGWAIFFIIKVILIVVFLTIKIAKPTTSSANYKPDPLPLPRPTSNCITPSSYLEFGSIDVKTSSNILGNMNRFVDPCENFYEFACHGWEEKNSIPDYAPEWNIYSVMEEKAMNTVIEMLEKPVHKDDIKSYKQAKNLYDKCMKTNSDENEETQFIIDTLENYGGWPILYENGTWNPENFDWMKSVVALAKRFKQPTLFDISSHQDPFGRIRNNTVFVSLPDSVTGKRGLRLLEPDDVSEDLADAIVEVLDYRNFIGNVSKILMEFKGLKEFDEDFVRDQAMEIILMQSKVAELADSHVLDSFRSLFGFDKANTRISLYNLQLMIDIIMGQNDTISFKSLLDTFYESSYVHISHTENLYVANINYVLEVIHLVQKVPKSLLANYLHYQMIKGIIPLTNGKLRKLFENRTISQYGLKKFIPERQRCARLVHEKFRFALEHKYMTTNAMDKCEMKNILGEVNDMIKNMKERFAALKQTLPPFFNKQELDILIKGTQVCVSQPDWITDSMRVQLRYAGLQLNQQSFLEQQFAYNEWLANSKLQKLRDILNPEQCYWENFPEETGAFANVESLQIYLPLGILQTPFFQPGRHVALNYGQLGSTIGHELVHIFSKFGWETNKDGSHTLSSQCLINQYSNFTVDELRSKNVFLNGNQTLTENFADNAGIRIAFEAYLNQKYMRTGGLQRQRRTALREYTDDQLFFLGFAQKWCESTTEEFMRTALETKEHSPAMFRVLGTLQNSQHFAEAWKCPIGSKMNPRVDLHKKCDLFPQKTKSFGRLSYDYQQRSYYENIS